MLYQGKLKKMKTSHDADSSMVNYKLNLNGEGVLDLNPLLGQEIEINFAGNIFCVYCERHIKKTFGDGFCFPCFQKLAQCDFCILKPSKCHFHIGTCRDEAWAQDHCFIEHTLYLARSSCIKIGLTRSNQKIHRWMDQGAIEALEIGSYDNRYKAGLAEDSIAQHFSDKTNWRKMLKNEVSDEAFDFYKEKAFEAVAKRLKTGLIQEGKNYKFKYPVLEYPEKINSKSLDKLPKFKAKLMGIKGQYLILDSHVLNLRKHSGYEIEFYC